MSAALGAPLHVDSAELEVIARVEPELAGLAHALHLDRVLVCLPVGRVRIRWVRDGVEELLQACLHAFELCFLARTTRREGELAIRAALRAAGHQVPVVTSGGVSTFDQA